MTSLPPLATSRYQSWPPGHGIPIRTSLGYPRFWRHGPLAYVRELAPAGVFRNPAYTTEAAMSEAYTERLDALSDEIVEALVALGGEHPGETLTLLCFEDVLAGQSCHRRWAAAWFERRHGVAVPELPAP
jgi:hypothetical protein